MKRIMLFFPYAVLAVICGVIALANWPTKVGGAKKDIASNDHTPRCAMCHMPMDGSQYTIHEEDETTYTFCSKDCERRFRTLDKYRENANRALKKRSIDVVCHMEVNPSWGITSSYNGRDYYFCNVRCKEQFDTNPERFLQVRCPVCAEPVNERFAYPATYLGNTYYLCSDAHRVEFKRDPAAYFMHSMWGIPAWLYYASIAFVLIVSFGVFEWISRLAMKRPEKQEALEVKCRKRNREQYRAATGVIAGEGERLVAAAGLKAGGGEVALPRFFVGANSSQTGRRTTCRTGDRIDLLGFPLVREALRSRIFRFALRALLVFIFLIIIAAGIFGNQNPAMNIAPILTWTVWWGFLIILILYAGKSWCYVCPWDALAEWTEKLAFWRKRNDGLSAGLKWPRVVRNILIATILFVGLTWVELGFGVTMRPRVTAYLAIAMLLMAVTAALLFDRKSFCRYGCLVGRVSGLYALFSSVEVRSRDATTCKKCRTKECVRGSESAYGCPTFLYPGKMDANTYCIQCMECIQACPHDNLAVNLRPWGEDLIKEGKPRADEAYLALLMLAITGFHGLTMTPAWGRLVDAIQSESGVGRIAGFSLGMALLMIGPILVYAGLVGASMWLGRRQAKQPLRYRDYFIRYAYALLPIALFYHIAHNMEHLLMEGPKVVALASDPFGWGWNVFGTAHWIIPPLISLDKLWLIQVALVIIGHVYSLWVAQKTSLRLFGEGRAAFRSQLPMLAAMIAFSVFSLWLLKQPMEMRTSAM